MSGGGSGVGRHAPGAGLALTFSATHSSQLAPLLLKLLNVFLTVTTRDLRILGPDEERAGISRAHTDVSVLAKNWSQSALALNPLPHREDMNPLLPSSLWGREWR